jgi:hypothetical protein
MAGRSKKHDSLVVGDKRIEIDHKSSFHFDYVCNFAIIENGLGTMYSIHLTKEQAMQPTRALLMFLLGHTSKASVLRSFRPV